MKTIDLLTDLNRQGIVTGKQLRVLSALHLQERFSLHDELRICIYGGILLILAGLGFTIKQYFTQLGDVAIIGSLSACALGAFFSCFLTGRPYANEAVAPPNMVFDYVLFFGCTVYSLDVAYVETRFHLLADLWIEYLLVSSALFFYLAYRFDNRLVLSLALSTLAAWLGFKLSPNLLHFQEYHRPYAIAYALFTLSIGSALYRAAIKRHFLDIYLNFAVHFLFAALVSGVAQYRGLSLYFPSLLACAALVAAYGLRTRRFLYLAYAAIYAYVGVSIAAADFLHGNPGVLYVYLIASSIGMVGLLYVLSLKFREE